MLWRMTTEQTAVEAQIRALEDQRYRAMERGDVEVLGRLFHPELNYSHSNGAQDTRESLLDLISKGHFVYGPIEHPIDRIVITGGTALVVHAMKAVVQVGGEERKLNNSALAVWVREGEEWLLAGYQPTPLPAA